MMSHWPLSKAPATAQQRHAANCVEQADSLNDDDFVLKTKLSLSAEMRKRCGQ